MQTAKKHLATTNTTEHGNQEQIPWIFHSPCAEIIQQSE